MESDPVEVPSLRKRRQQLTREELSEEPLFLYLQGLSKTHTLCLYSLALNFQVNNPNFSSDGTEDGSERGWVLNKGQSPGPVKFIFTLIVYMVKVQVLINRKLLRP